MKEVYVHLFTSKTKGKESYVAFRFFYTRYVPFPPVLFSACVLRWNESSNKTNGRPAEGASVPHVVFMAS